MTKTNDYLLKINEQSKDKITITHIFTKAIAIALTLNIRYVGRIQFGNFVQEDEVSITVAVDQNSQDLVPVLVRKPHVKSIPEIAAELNEKVLKVKHDKDEDQKNLRKVFGHLPSFLMQPFL